VLQILGSGDASKTHQRFELKSLPLTFVSAESETGATSTLTIRVNDVAWSEQPNLVAATPRDRAYSLRIEDDGKAVVQFGDGQHGARLPSGQGNVLASYRRGIGASGNVGAGQLSQLLTRPLGLKAATHPAAAEGGTDPDDAESARRTMPLGVRTLGRAVSLRDYEDFARAFTGIGKAHAAVLNLKAGRTIFITVAAEDGAPLSSTNPVLTRLVGALRKSGDPLVRFEVQPNREATFQLRLRVKRDPAYLRDAVTAAIESALHAAFSFDTREFGQPVALSEVIAVADGVAGVIAVDVDHFYRGTKRVLARRLAAALPHVDASGNGVAAELLTLAPGPLEWLGEMP
jgi:predicted phage baseplate assembly protein